MRQDRTSHGTQILSRRARSYELLRSTSAVAGSARGRSADAAWRSPYVPALSWHRRKAGHAPRQAQARARWNGAIWAWVRRIMLQDSGAALAHIQRLRIAQKQLQRGLAALVNLSVNAVPNHTPTAPAPE